MIFNVAKFLTKASLAISVYLFASGVSVQASDLDCHPMPDCEKLGYSQTYDPECSANGYIYCPFDKSYKKCVNYSCERMGFTTEDKSSWCLSIVQCPNDPAYTLCDQLCDNTCPDGKLYPTCAYGLDPNPVARTGCNIDCYKCASCWETCADKGMLTQAQAEAQCAYGISDEDNIKICEGGTQEASCYKCAGCTDVCDGKRFEEMPEHFNATCYSYRESTVCGRACYEDVAAYTCSHFNDNWTEDTSDTKNYKYQPVEDAPCGLTCYTKVSRGCPSSGGAVGTINKATFEAQNYYCTPNGTNESGEQCYLCTQCSDTCAGNSWSDSAAGVNTGCNSVTPHQLSCGKTCYEIKAKTCNDFNPDWWENIETATYAYTYATTQCGRDCYTKCKKTCPADSSTTNLGAGYNCSDVGTNECGETCWSCSEINCVHGTLNGSTCVCQKGWEGEKCDTPSPCNDYTHLSCQELENAEPCKKGDETYYKCTPKQCHEIMVGGRPLSDTCAEGESKKEYSKIGGKCYLCSDAICNLQTFEFLGTNYAYETTSGALSCLTTEYSIAAQTTLSSGGASQQCYKCECDTGQAIANCRFESGNDKEALSNQCCNGNYKTCERKCDGYAISQSDMENKTGNAAYAKSFEPCDACGTITYKINECQPGYTLSSGVCAVSLCADGYSISITESDCHTNQYEEFKTAGYSAGQVCGQCHCNSKAAGANCQAESSGGSNETLGTKCCNDYYTSCTRNCAGYTISETEKTNKTGNAAGAAEFYSCTACGTTTYKIKSCQSEYALQNGACVNDSCPVGYEKSPKTCGIGTVPAEEYTAAGSKCYGCEEVECDNSEGYYLTCPTGATCTISNGCYKPTGCAPGYAQQKSSPALIFDEFPFNMVMNGQVVSSVCYKSTGGCNSDYYGSTKGTLSNRYFELATASGCTYASNCSVDYINSGTVAESICDYGYSVPAAVGTSPTRRACYECLDKETARTYCEAEGYDIECVAYGSSVSKHVVNQGNDTAFCCECGTLCQCYKTCRYYESSCNQFGTLCDAFQNCLDACYREWSA